MKKRLAAIILFVIFMFPAWAVMELDEDDISMEEWIDLSEEEESTLVFDTDGYLTVTITCTGDFTIGGDNYHNKTAFYDVLNNADNQGDINFTMKNVRDILKADNLTIVNFEGTFTDSQYVPRNKRDNKFLFNISPNYANVLPDNSIEAVSLANNHVMDHGEEAYEETKKTLREAGVIYSTQEDIGEFHVNDTITIAMLSYLCIDMYGKPAGGYDTFEEKVCADITRAKEQYPLVIVSFHWGNEPTKTDPARGYQPTKNQLRLGRMAVDAGADLIIGNHSHRIQPIEYYNGSYICYSLGNFCFSGNDNPSDMNAILFQTRFRFSKSGNVANTGIKIIPIQITSIKGKNNYQPTPITDEMKQKSVIQTMVDNGKKYCEYSLNEYPLEWK